jgi:hypothetical protein
MSLSALRRGAPWLAAVAAASLLVACGTSTPLPPDPAPAAPVAVPQSGPEAGAVTPPPVVDVRVSAAGTARAYRQDAASHLYVLNQDRIYKGRLPPLLYAIGVLQVEVDRAGQVRSVSWMRAPKHAPEVIAEIERTVRAAAPFPVPAKMGRVVYTDTWLWHKSGRFQLDTLTEGQD